LKVPPPPPPAPRFASQAAKPITSYEPFFQMERLKQDSLHQLERFAERLEDFDF
jgi:hypothetical protein